MPIKLKTESAGKTLVVHVSGKLTKVDYAQFVPEFEHLVRLHGKLRVLFDLTGLHGVDGGALREDINFGVDHFFDIERIAMVGDRKWEEFMSILGKACTAATVRYFDHTDIAAARKWLAEEQ